MGRPLAPARAHLKSAAPALDLRGSWDFTLVGGHELRTGTTPVPSHWALVDDGAWGRPAYRNVQCPFPVDPPFVPDPNPTGTCRRT